MRLDGNDIRNVNASIRNVNVLSEKYKKNIRNVNVNVNGVNANVNASVNAISEKCNQELNAYFCELCDRSLAVDRANINIKNFVKVKIFFAKNVNRDKNSELIRIMEEKLSAKDMIIEELKGQIEVL